MRVIDAMEYLRRAVQCAGSRGGDMELVVAVHEPGRIGPSAHVSVLGIDGGIDWDAGRVLIRTDPEVTTLTDSEREAITQSVRAGQSWHAYQAQKKLQARNDALEAELAQLRTVEQRG